MNIASARSAQLWGLQARQITVEVDISRGLHAFTIVGLGDRAVDEAKDRIAAAIKNSGFVSPKQKNQKVVISLAPADIRKEGPSFDLAMALAYLSATGDLHAHIPDHALFFGELSLDGRVRRTGGILPLLVEAPTFGISEAYIAEENSAEAAHAVSEAISIFPVRTLNDAIAHLQGAHRIPALKRVSYSATTNTVDSPTNNLPTMQSVRGHSTAKRALEIAATGGHAVMLCGSPGTGKTLLAQSFPSILPLLGPAAALEAMCIRSAAGIHDLPSGSAHIPPFRAPHHTASLPALLGGGPLMRPGEITLAHHGTLFLDELPEFDRRSVEALRQPLEEGCIRLSRARNSVEFPARCIVIAAMNPCPCGRMPGPECTCSQSARERYRRKISGPIQDRFDLWVDIPEVEHARFADPSSHEETSSQIRERVCRARQYARERFKSTGDGYLTNSEITASDLDRLVACPSSVRIQLMDFAAKLSLSGRAIHRTMKIARTIADLGGRARISEADILEALRYRRRT